MIKKYKIGFTRPALLRETVLVAQIYCEQANWDCTKRVLLSENLLQARTQRSGDILFSEVQSRLKLLSTDQISVLAADHTADVSQLVWIILCKRHSFIADFTLEVMIHAVSAGREGVDYDDYGYFFNSKTDWHPELEAVSDKTRSNARQALFQMMRQCNLINEGNQFIPQMISAALHNCTPESELVYIPGAIRL